MFSFLSRGKDKNKKETKIVTTQNNENMEVIGEHIGGGGLDSILFDIINDDTHFTLGDVTRERKIGSLVWFYGSDDNSKMINQKIMGSILWVIQNGEGYHFENAGALCSNFGYINSGAGAKSEQGRIISRFLTDLSLKDSNIVEYRELRLGAIKGLCYMVTDSNNVEVKNTLKKIADRQFYNVGEADINNIVESSGLTQKWLLRNWQK